MHFVISKDNIPECWENFKEWIHKDHSIEHPFLGHFSYMIQDPIAFDEDLAQFGATVDVIEDEAHLGDEYWKERQYHIIFETDAHYTAFLLKFGSTNPVILPEN